MCTNPPLPHHFGLTSVSQLGRMVYLAYMQGPNAADEVKIMFEIWKSHQNLKHSTATARQKLNRSYGMKCTLSCLKIFVEVPNSLWKAVERGCFFDSGTVVQSKGELAVVFGSGRRDISTAVLIE